jgi:serine/threonine-protein kinase
MASFFDRLKERKLFQWALAYGAGAWALLEGVDLVGGQFDWSTRLLQSITILVAVGFLVVLVLAWYHGEKGRQRVSGPELMMITVLLIIAGGVLSFLGGDGRSGSLSREGEERPGIAVLPCENFSPSADDAYLAAGLHEEILLRLSKISSLLSIGRESVEWYRDNPRPLPEVAAELGVGFIGECSVRKDPQADLIRLTFQLLDETGAQIWAENFDRDLTAGNLFELESDVAQEVASALGARISPEEQSRVGAKPTENSEAYALFLRGMDYWARPGVLEANVEIAEEMWQRAIDLDPDFALARAKLSYLHGVTYFYSRDFSDERIEEQRFQAMEALRLQPDLPWAHFAMGYYHYVQGDLDAALEELRIAQQGAPNDPEPSKYIGYTSRRLGDWGAWEEAYHTSIQLNPRDVNIHYNLGGSTLSHLRRYSDAVAALDRALELAPDFDTPAIRKGRYFVRWMGELDTLRTFLDSRALDENLYARLDLARWDRDPDRLSEILEIGPDVWESQGYIIPRHLVAAWAHRIRGDEDAARLSFDSARVMLDSIIFANPDDFRVHGAMGYTYAGLGQVAEATESAGRYVAGGTANAPGDVYFTPGYQVIEAEILAQAGEAEAAVDALDHLLSVPSPISVPLLRLDPIWDPLRADPRFQALLEKYGSEP